MRRLFAPKSEVGRSLVAIHLYTVHPSDGWLRAPSERAVSDPIRIRHPFKMPRSWPPPNPERPFKRRTVRWAPRTTSILEGA